MICGDGGILEEEVHPYLNWTSLFYQYDSLHSKKDGFNWYLHGVNVYLGLNSTWEALHLRPSEHFPLRKIVGECDDGFLRYFHSKNEMAVLIY